MFNNKFSGKKRNQNIQSKVEDITRRGFEYQTGDFEAGEGVDLKFKLRTDIPRELEGFLMLLKRACKDVKEELSKVEGFEKNDADTSEKIDLIIAQSAPNTLVGLWKSADLNYLKDKVLELIEEEKESLLEELRNN